MSSINVYSIGREAEGERWQDVAMLALWLDRDDFLPTGYKVSAKLKNPANAPARERVNTRRSNRFPSSATKRRRTDNVNVVEDVTNDEDETEDENNEEYDSDFVPNMERVDDEENDNMEKDLCER